LVRARGGRGEEKEEGEGEEKEKRGEIPFHGAIPHTHGYIGLLRRHNSKNNFSFLVER